MRRMIQKLNNQGSTLLTVVICIAFVGILGSLMLSVTMTNLQMKIIENRSKENFYSCEMAMEEIRTGIEELTASSIQYVYKNHIINNFEAIIGRDAEELNADIRKKVGTNIMKQLGMADAYSEDQLASGMAVKARDHILDTYLSAPPTGVTISVKIGEEAADTPIYFRSGDTVVIEDISVKLTKKDYETSITSDIAIALPEFTFDEGEEHVVYRMDQPFLTYALLADGLITSDQTTGVAARSIVNGNVYGGVGIAVDGQNLGTQTLEFHSAKLISRGLIQAMDTGKLVIKGPEGADYAAVWADNLRTITSPEYQSLGIATSTRLDIDGYCFIKDDLTLDGTNSIVQIKGAYLGYTGENSSRGSAMIINGAGSSLNLSGLKLLILAGRANVSIDDRIQSVDITNEIMTGESIAFKSNQRAYLIPGRYIRDVKRNPITKEDSILDPGVDFSLPSEINFSNYVDHGKPYKIASKQTNATDSSSLLRYYYLNFATGVQADRYLRAFVDQNPTALNIMDPFRLGQVLLPNNPDGSTIYTVGNRMSYNGAEVSLTAGNRFGLDETVDSAVLEQQLRESFGELLLNNPEINHGIYDATGLPSDTRLGMLERVYSKLNHLLYLESNRAYRETDPTVGSFLISGGLNTIANDPDNLYLKFMNEDSSSTTLIDAGDIDLSTPSILIVKEDVVLDTDFNGILIASGNITIGDNVTVNGLVVTDGSYSGSSGNITVGNQVTVNGRLIAVGDIALGNNNTINGDNTAFDSSGAAAILTELFEYNGHILQKIFRYVNVTVNFTIANPADHKVDLSALISYENWRKN